MQFRPCRDFQKPRVDVEGFAWIAEVHHHPPDYSGVISCIAEDLYQLAFGRRAQVADEAQVGRTLAQASAETESDEFSARFLVSEWTQIVDAWQVDNEEFYANVPRLGRKNRLGSRQRARLWTIFQSARAQLNERRLKKWPQVFGEMVAYYAPRAEKPFSHIVVDEAQDVGVPELHLFASIALIRLHSDYDGLP